MGGDDGQTGSLEVRRVRGSWGTRVAAAVEHVGTPCYVCAWRPVAEAAARLAAIPAAVPIELWLSFKTHPVKALAESWFRHGLGGVEVVSESELLAVMALGVPPDRILVNGIAKQSWLHRHGVPRLNVHFDSLGEIDALLPLALEHRWRVGIRCHVPGEHDAREPQFGGQFGLDRPEALAAIDRLRRTGAHLTTVHFHLGQGRRQPNACSTALTYIAGICDDAGFAPSIVDCGGGLPTAASADAGDADRALADLEAAIRLAPQQFPALRAIWLENGRFVTEASAVLAIRVVEIKERGDCRYLICDGGRTNHALAADAHPRPIAVLENRTGRRRLTTVCGPTCMTDDRLGRSLLPEDIEVGDILVWPGAGAYHLPWETRFSHGLCPVAWFDRDEQLSVAREREQPGQYLAEQQAHHHA